MKRGFLKSTPAFVASLVFAGIVVIGGAVMIGRSDSGQINVSATINESNQQLSPDGTAQNAQVNAVPEAFKNMPNGGLVPQGGESAPAEQATQGESQDGQASTTNTAASSTEPASEGGASSETQTGETPVATESQQ